MAKPKAKKNRKPKGSNTPITAPVSDKAYEIRLSATAEQAYENFYDLASAARARGELTNQHITALNMIDEVLETIIPRDPFNRKFAL